MIIKKIRTSFLVIFSLATIFFSCSDDWNNHYSEVTLSNKSDKNLYEFIKSRDNLTKFTKLLETSGYDSLLKQSQAFTVWAPNDEALSAIDVSDKSLALQIVKNSIARYSYTTSGITTRVVPMLNKKLIPLQKSDNGYAFNEEVISEPDLGAANGILHVTSNYVPYKMNIWEFINNTTGLDSLKQYANSLDKLELDTAASFLNGVFVDSVFKVTNKLLDNLGSLNVEDSIYTALLLDNTAWKAGYDKVFPYYKTTLADGGVATQVKNAKWSLAQNLFYRGEIDFPTSKANLSSTGHIRTYEPNTVFQNSQKNDLSNGLGYVTSSFNIKDTASWNKPIVMEAEYGALYGATLFNYSSTTRNGAGMSAPVSNGDYASLTDISVNALTKPYVTFLIPYTLATKYNIYCVFIPKKEVDPADMRPYKVRFYVNYLNSQGTAVTTGYVDSKNTVQTSSSALATFTTDPNSIQKMLVAKNVTLPYSNVTFNGLTSDENIKNIKFSLKIETNVGKNEAGFTRNMLIDCIILEPVIE
jgi:hypothetical protein